MRISAILDAVRNSVLAYNLPAEHVQITGDALHLVERLGTDGVQGAPDVGRHLAFDVFRLTADLGESRGSNTDPPRLVSSVDFVLAYAIRHDQQRADADRALDLMDALTVRLLDLDLGNTLPDANVIAVPRFSDVISTPHVEDPYLVMISTLQILHSGRVG